MTKKRPPVPPAQAPASTRLLGILAVTDAVLTTLWLVLLIVDAAARTGNEPRPILPYVANPPFLYYATFVNAALITVATTMLLAVVYRFVKPAAPDWALAGLIFLPVYCTFNLFVYLSQVAVVPRLAARAVDEASILLLIQSDPGSIAGLLNGLAYAVLGIPSIVFGVLLARRQGALRMGGVLLALSGAASIVGMVGSLARVQAIGLGTVAGGALFLLALVALSWGWLRPR